MLNDNVSDNLVYQKSSNHFSLFDLNGVPSQLVAFGRMGHKPLSLRLGVSSWHCCISRKYRYLSRWAQINRCESHVGFGGNGLRLR
jgi:hypothetical protein